MSVTEARGTALITGASSGIGPIFADPGPPIQPQASPVSRNMT
jgi:hypothetical protein